MKTSFLKLLPTEADTIDFAANMANLVPDTAVIYLYGNLGAGKTTFTRGFLRSLGYKDKVKSPTYTIVEPYEIEDKKIFHFDLYRVADPTELEYIGIKDYFSPGNICIVEWPELGGDFLPAPDLCCYIEPKEVGREIRLEANSETGKQIIKRIIATEAE